MKTAMQLAFERIELMKDISEDDAHWQMFKQTYLEKEKEQIMIANQKGYVEGGRYFTFGMQPKSSEQYYNETYQNK